MRLRFRRTSRLVVIVAGALAAGAAAVVFAKLCDYAQAAHSAILAISKPLALLLLPLGLAGAVWAARRMAPESAGSGIPQIIAAAESQRSKLAPDPRISMWTALWKIVICAGLLLCGASIGREGPTVQVAAAVVYLLAARIHGGPARRALLIAGGAAGVAAAFNAPIAGVVFAVEELARGFDRRSNTVVILVVVAAGAAAYAMSGNYAYFNVSGELAGASAWWSAPILGVVCGLFGGAFSWMLASVIGPNPGRLGLWKARRPIAFAFGCGVVAALAALASRGLTYGTGYAEASSLLAGHPGRGVTLAAFKWVANLAAAGSGAPGGLFSPSLTAGAGVGAAFAHIFPMASSRDAIVLGMAAYLAGVVQAPLTSAVILMEMTRDPGLVGPLMLAALIARAVSSTLMPEPIYHLLSHTWRRPRLPASLHEKAERRPDGPARLPLASSSPNP